MQPLAFSVMIQRWHKQPEKVHSFKGLSSNVEVAPCFTVTETGNKGMVFNSWCQTKYRELEFVLNSYCALWKPLDNESRAWEGWGFRRPFSFTRSSETRKRQYITSFLILWVFALGPATRNKIHVTWSPRQKKQTDEQRSLGKAGCLCHVTQLASLVLIKRGNENIQTGVEMHQGFPKMKSGLLDSPK